MPSLQGVNIEIKDLKNMVLFFRPCSSQATLNGHICSGLSNRKTAASQTVFTCCTSNLCDYISTVLLTYLHLLHRSMGKSLMHRSHCAALFCFVSKQILLLGGKLHWMCTIFT